MRLAPALCALVLFGSACSDKRNDDGPVRHIVYWEKWTDFEGEAMDRVVDSFNAKERTRAQKEPGYRPIEVEKVTISRIEDKLLVASAGGNPPDVAGFYTARVAAYADKGALRDLTELSERDGLDRSHYVEHYFDLSVYRGRVWGLPTTPASVGLLWNKRLFREAGLDPEKPPETIEQLDEMAEKLTKWEVALPDGAKEVRTGYLPEVPASRKRLLQLGFLPGEPDWWSYGWGFVFGGRLIEGNDKIAAFSPENVRAYRWVASYSQKIGVDAIKRFRSGFGNFGTAENPFLSSRLAMQIQGVWMHNFIKKFADGMPWGAAPFPAPADRPDLHGAANAEADNLVIPAASKHPEEAWEFVRYVQSQPAMEQLCLGQRKHSPLRHVSDEFWAQHPNPYIKLFAELGSLPSAWAAPQTGVWNEYSRELNTVAGRIQSLNITPEDGLKQVQDTMQRSLDRENAVYARRHR